MDNQCDSLGSIAHFDLCLAAVRNWCELAVDRGRGSNVLKLRTNNPTFHGDAFPASLEYSLLPSWPSVCSLRRDFTVRFGFITLGTRVPSTRFRFLPYLSYFRKHDHRCHLWMSRPSVYEHIPWLGWRISHALKRTVRRFQLLQARLFKPDCIYLERGCLNDESIDLDQAFRRTTSRLVLDVDDGIFLEQPDKIDKLIAMSDHVIVSNELIYDYVRDRHDRVTIIPTAVSMARYKPKPIVESAKLTIGWIGTVPNMPFLGVCAEALRELAQKHEYELLVVGPSEEPLRSIDLAGVDVRFERWQASTEIEALHQMDIGIMPLPAGKAWMRYKAATKLVQYLSVGIPAVASPIGVNRTILCSDEVGFAAADTTQWISALDCLLSDEGLRYRLGQNGRRLVTERYSVEANAQRLLNVLTGVSN